MKEHRYRNEKAPGAATPEAQSSNPTLTKGEHMDISTSLAPNVYSEYIAMTSLEISELVEKRHNNVKRTIETLASKDLVQLAQIEQVRNHLGQKVSVYLVGKRDSYVIVAQLSPEFTARLVDRWQELEEKATHPQIPQTMSEALRLAADQAEVIEKQKHDLLIAAPKVAFADQVRIAEDAITMAEAAKLIGTGRGRFFTFMRQQKWITRGGEPYQAKIEAGLMDVKVSHWEHPNEGLKQNVTPLVTGKGLVKLQKLWAEREEHAA